MVSKWRNESLHLKTSIAVHTANKINCQYSFNHASNSHHFSNTRMIIILYEKHRRPPILPTSFRLLIRKIVRRLINMQIVNENVHAYYNSHNKHSSSISFNQYVKEIKWLPVNIDVKIIKHTKVSIWLGSHTYRISSIFSLL